MTELADTLRAASPPDTIDLLLGWLRPRDTSVLLVIDDVHLVGHDLAQSLDRLVEGWPTAHRLVLAGRRLPAPLGARLLATDTLLLGRTDLQLRSDEAEAVLAHEAPTALDGDVLELVTAGCQGWVGAIVLASQQLDRAASRSDTSVQRLATDLMDGSTPVSRLLEHLIQALPKPYRVAIGQLATLPALDDELVRSTVIEGGIDELLDLGLPLDECSADLWELPEFVRDALRTGVRDERTSRLAAERYMAHRRPAAALDVLGDTGLRGELASTLSSLPPAVLLHLPIEDHAAAVAGVAYEQLVAHPRILLQLAESYALVEDWDACQESVERARQVLTEGVPDLADDPVSLEVHAAELTISAVVRNDTSLAEDAERLLAHPDLPPMVRAHLLGSMGRAMASDVTASALRTGARRFMESTRAFEREGAVAHAAASRVVSATVTSVPLGHYDRALTELHAALTSAPTNQWLRLAVLPQQAFILIELGRYAQAEHVLAVLRRTVTGGARQRAAVYARWAAARMASQRGQEAATWAACRAVEHSEVDVDTGNGTYFRADAARLLARVGHTDEAERLLIEARRRDVGNGTEVLVGELAIAAHTDDLPRADAVMAQLDDGRAIAPRDRWQLTLLHAYTCHRAGDPRATPLAATAFEEAGQLGHPGLPLIREPQIAQELLAIAGPGSASALDAARLRGPRIRLLGCLEVEHDGRTTEPSGRSAELIAFLGLHGGQATVGESIEAMWPDSEASRGRERLRTVLRRTRRAHGELIERHGALLRFSGPVTTDVEEFNRFCRAVSTQPQGSSAAAAAALALYGGAAVPSLENRSWVEAARTRLELKAIAMHDAMAQELTVEGLFDGALHSLLAGLAMEPTAEDRYLAAATLFAGKGLLTPALRLLEQARTSLADSGLEPSGELDRLERYLLRAPEAEPG